MSKEIVEGLLDREDENGFVNFQRADRLLPGNKVSIIDGLFAQNSGVIEKISSNDRVLLLLDLIDRQFKLNTTLDRILVSV